jgi:hypothetical protein
MRFCRWGCRGYDASRMRLLLYLVKLTVGQSLTHVIIACGVREGLQSVEKAEGGAQLHNLHSSISAVQSTEGVVNQREYCQGGIAR